MADSWLVNSKVTWRGTVTSVQPRIRLRRSFDQRHHNYLGYVLRLDGEVRGGHRESTIAIGKAAPTEHMFAVGRVADCVWLDRRHWSMITRQCR